MSHSLPVAALRAGACIGGLLVLGWLGRMGLTIAIGGVAAGFLALVGILLAVQYPQAAGNALDALLCWLATRSRAMARGWQSYRVGYNCEVNAPMQPIRSQFLTEAK